MIQLGQQTPVMPTATSSMLTAAAPIVAPPIIILGSRQARLGLGGSFNLSVPNNNNNNNIVYPIKAYLESIGFFKTLCLIRGKNT